MFATKLQVHSGQILVIFRSGF